MFDLRRERVGSLKRDCLGLKRFEPGAVFLPRVTLEPHRWNRKRTVRSHHHIGVFIGICRVGSVLLRRLSQDLAEAAVSDNRKAPSAPFSKCRLIATVSSTGNLRIALDA